MEELKPGTAVHIVLEMSDPNRGMSTIVYDIIGKKIVIAQTSPPLLRSHLGESVRVSFLVKIKGIKDTRLAFSANIIEFIPNYEMSSFQTVPAVLLEQKTQLEEIDRRMFYRLAPPLRTDLKIMLGNEKVGIIDVSLGGVRITHSMKHIMQANEEIELTIFINSRLYKVMARIIRVEQKFDNVKSKKIQVMALQFETITQEFGRALAMKIMMMERQRLAEGKY